jgi:hypothetical protein
VTGGVKRYVHLIHVVEHSFGCEHYVKACILHCSRGTNADLVLQLAKTTSRKLKFVGAMHQTSPKR